MLAEIKMALITESGPLWKSDTRNWICPLVTERCLGVLLQLFVKIDLLNYAILKIS